MIDLPRRSVTRFFIPLIDVLILLFCIFLLMPFVSGPPAETAPDAKAAQEKPLPDDVKTLQAMLKEEQLRVARLEKERHARITDLSVQRILRIGYDEKGMFVYFFDPGRQVIRSEADAVSQFTRQKALAARGGVVREVAFILPQPRDEKGVATGHPTGPELAQIKQWFKEMPFRYEPEYDNPR